MSHNIVPDQQNEDIDFGKFIHEDTYKKNKKEILFGNVKFDVILENKDELVIGETKKSSTYEHASKWQLLYYLKVLKKAGIIASGQLLYPLLKKRVDVLLGEKEEKELGQMEKNITEIIQMDKPLEPRSCKYCKKCGYYEYCYS